MKKGKRENEYQIELKKHIKDALPTVTILKNNPNDILGIPDLTILGEHGKYAILEVKKDDDAKYRPLQEYYLHQFSAQGAYTNRVEPSNEEQVINDLTNYFNNI